ncbi:MAG: hypothetical protein FWD17_07245 [Polyangiaceae bacterium]|nr:hypothetical protein [Polyangiaceae bacterium]
MKGWRGGALVLATGGALLAFAPRPAGAVNPTLAQCIAANEDAIQARHQHKLREARARSLACAFPSCPGELRDACDLRVRDLNAAIPSIVFLARDEVGHDLVDVRVRMDGEIVGESLDGTAIAVDPGQHTFSFEATGRPPVEESLVVSEGEKDRREIVTLPSGEAPSATAQPAGGSEAAPDAPPVPGQSAGRVQRTAGIVIGAVGLLGLGVGGVGWGLAASRWSKARADCNGQLVSCTYAGTPGARAEKAANTFATVADVGFIAGGALVVGGVVAFLTAPKGIRREPRSAVEVLPWAAPAASGLTVRGEF